MCDDDALATGARAKQQAPRGFVLPFRKRACRRRKATEGTPFPPTPYLIFLFFFFAAQHSRGSGSGAAAVST